MTLWCRRGRLARGAATAALVLLGALVLGGCLESQETVRLAKDGNGRFVQKVTMDAKARDELLRRLARLHGAEQDPEILPYADPFSPAWIRARAEESEGYVLEKVERVEDEDGRLTTQVVARFDQLACGGARGRVLHGERAPGPVGQGPVEARRVRRLGESPPGPRRGDCRSTCSGLRRGGPRTTRRLPSRADLRAARQGPGDERDAGR